MVVGEVTAASLKSQGNVEFSSGKYESAIALYSKAIGLDPKFDHVLYSNRSACYLKLEKFKNAIEDARSCIKLSPRWAKGYIRLGNALAATDHSDLAIKVYNEGINRCDGDKSTLQLALSNVTSKVNKKPAIKTVPTVEKEEKEPSQPEIPLGSADAAEREKETNLLLGALLEPHLKMCKDCSGSFCRSPGLTLDDKSKSHTKKLLKRLHQIALLGKKHSDVLFLTKSLSILVQFIVNADSADEQNLRNRAVAVFASFIKHNRILIGELVHRQVLDPAVIQPLFMKLLHTSVHGSNSDQLPTVLVLLRCVVNDRNKGFTLISIEIIDLCLTVFRRKDVEVEFQNEVLNIFRQIASMPFGNEWLMKGGEQSVLNTLLDFCEKEKPSDVLVLALDVLRAMAMCEVSFLQSNARTHQKHVGHQRRNIKLPMEKLKVQRAIVTTFLGKLKQLLEVHSVHNLAHEVSGTLKFGVDQAAANILCVIFANLPKENPELITFVPILCKMIVVHHTNPTLSPAPQPQKFVTVNVQNQPPPPLVDNALLSACTALMTFYTNQKATCLNQRDPKNAVRIVFGPLFTLPKFVPALVHTLLELPSNLNNPVATLFSHILQHKFVCGQVMEKCLREKLPDVVKKIRALAVFESLNQKQPRVEMIRLKTSRELTSALCYAVSSSEVERKKFMNDSYNGCLCLLENLEICIQFLGRMHKMPATALTFLWDHCASTLEVAFRNSFTSSELRDHPALPRLVICLGHLASFPIQIFKALGHNPMPLITLQAALHVLGIIAAGSPQNVKFFANAARKIEKTEGENVQSSAVMFSDQSVWSWERIFEWKTNDDKIALSKHYNLKRGKEKHVIASLLDAPLAQLRTCYEMVQNQANIDVKKENADQHRQELLDIVKHEENVQQELDQRRQHKKKRKKKRKKHNNNKNYASSPSPKLSSPNDSPSLRASPHEVIPEEVAENVRENAPGDVAPEKPQPQPQRDKSPSAAKERVSKAESPPDVAVPDSEAKDTSDIVPDVPAEEDVPVVGELEQVISENQPYVSQSVDSNGNGSSSSHSNGSGSSSYSNGDSHRGDTGFADEIQNVTPHTSPHTEQSTDSVVNETRRGEPSPPPAALEGQITPQFDPALESLQSVIDAQEAEAEEDPPVVSLDGERQSPLDDTLKTPLGETSWAHILQQAPGSAPISIAGESPSSQSSAPFLFSPGAPPAPLPSSLSAAGSGATTPSSNMSSTLPPLEMADGSFYNTLHHNNSYDSTPHLQSFRDPHFPRNHQDDSKFAHTFSIPHTPPQQQQHPPPPEHRCEKLEKLLTTLNMQRYLPKFLEEEIEIGDLPLLNDEQLRNFVPRVGPRCRLIAKIREFENVERGERTGELGDVERLTMRVQCLEKEVEMLKGVLSQRRGVGVRHGS